MSANFRLTLVIAAVSAIVAGCSTSQNVGTGAVPTWNNAAARAGFSLDVSDDSYIDGGSAGGYNLTVKEYGEDLVVSVEVEDAQNLKALYFDLDYNPAEVRPLSAEPTEAMGARGDVLNLISLKQRGTVQYGQVLGNWDWRTGFSGDGVVAEVMFRKEATPVLPRTVSAAPNSPASASVLLYDAGNTTAELQWDYANRGDYDQNSVANVSDLTPLGANLGEGDGTPFPRTSNLSVVDGDGNGQITVAELTPLGASLNNTVSGYSVYGSTDPADVDTLPNDPSDAADLIGTVDFAAKQGTPNTQRLTFSLDLTSTPAGMRYWVRPFQTGVAQEGTPSNAAGDVPAPNLTLAVPPAVGDGSVATPYVVEHSDTYTLILTDPVDGDVSADPATTYTTSDPAHVTFAGTTMTVGAGAVADFTVYGTYNGFNSNVLNFHIDITGGTGIKIMPDDVNAEPWQSAVAESVLNPPDTELGQPNSPYVLHSSTFNPDAGADGTYDLEFTLIAQDDQGGDLDENALTWSCFPPFIALDVNDASKGTFHANQFTVGYIQAQNASLENSNKFYVEVKLDQN